MKAAKKLEDELDEVLGDLTGRNAERRTYAKRLMTGRALVADARGTKFEQLLSFFRGTRISHRSTRLLTWGIADLLEAEQCDFDDALTHTIRHSHKHASATFIAKWLATCQAQRETATLDEKTKKYFVDQMSLVFIVIGPEATRKFLAN